MATAGAVSADDRMGYARILVEVGEPYDAEVQLARVLEERPDDLGALDLLAKIKHMRGELTAAIALWAQVHEHSPRNQTGLLRLSSMLQLARDAERGGGEFLVLGHFQLWRKPAAHLELEEVFGRSWPGGPTRPRSVATSSPASTRGTIRTSTSSPSWPRHGSPS